VRIAFVFPFSLTGTGRAGHGLPGAGRGPADVVLGQPSPSERAENRGGDVAADSFRWPHQLAVQPVPGPGGALGR
jgi:hypothetical protein